MTSNPFPHVPHDHHGCVRAAMARAEDLCDRRGVRLTELRRRVLELVWQSHVPVGAYQLMELLGRERGPVAPPTIYRALEFLGAQGLIHRIESLNAFIGCPQPGPGHRAYFLICDRCGWVAEIDDPTLGRALDHVAAEAGFAAAAVRVELSGTCAQCRSQAAA